MAKKKVKRSKMMHASHANDEGDIYLHKNEVMQIDLLTKLDKKMQVPLMAFFRHLGIPHVYSEGLVPTFEEGDGLACVAIQNRPWPPAGIDAQRVHALVLVHFVPGEWAGLGNIFLLDEDLGNVGLAACVYKRILEFLIKKNVKEVSYVVREGSILASRALAGLAFKKTSEIFLTPSARYFIHSASIKQHYAELMFDKVETTDLLFNKFSDELFGRFAHLLCATTLGTAPFWNGRNIKPEIIPNTKAAGWAVSGGMPKRL